jgi:mono/diheme cytochrome c family protein
MTIRMRHGFQLSSACILGFGLCLGWGGLQRSVAGAEDSPTRVDSANADFFESKIRPVLAAHCWECHGPDKQKSGLRLDSRQALLKGGDTGPAVTVGKPGESPLVEAIGYDGAVQMPPRGKLSNAEIASLTDWVKRGAPWPEHRADVKRQAAATASSESPSITAEDREFWSFRPVRQPEPPAVRDQSWPRSALDRFILAKLEASNLKPAGPADKQALLRRVTFDLVGLPPTPEQIEVFTNDKSPDAFAKVVDRLLASPHYGERWGRHWLDIARYGEDQAHSFQPRLYPCGFRYRDWLTQALNRDMPYGQFLVEQIAGDLIDGPGRLERLAALGFFAVGPVYYGDAKKFDQYADRIDTLTRGVLGLTVACARCHDHKFDPIPTTDYYALAGIFASTEYQEVPCAPKEQIEAYDKAQSAVQKKTQEINAYLKAEGERLKLKVPRNQIEKSLPAESRKKLAALRAELQQRKKSVPPKYPVVHTLADAPEPRTMKVLIRGNPETPGAVATRRFLAVLGGESAPFSSSGSGRIELAQAITDPANPLTSRVLVNRVWQHHFGRGLVATASNFGALGERPTHPELLDWLAARFVASGSSLKALHREILLSATYQQSSRFDARAYEVDPANTLLWRMNRRRLEVEAWRDAMLAVAGRLDRALGGPSVSLDATENHRRTYYAAISRHDLAPLLHLFDFPDPNITSGGRVETTVPLQQLFVLNSEFIVQTSRALVNRLGANSNSREDAAAHIRQAYLWLYGRAPTEREIELGLSFVGADSDRERGDLDASNGWRSAQPQTTGNGRESRPLQANLTRWEQYAQALLAANEFAYVD